MRNCIITNPNPEDWKILRRFEGEVEKFQKKWPEILEKGDPFYNPNLTLDSQDFSLKRL